MSAQPPRDLAEFAAVICASDEPAVVMIDRALIRELLAYVRALECRDPAGAWPHPDMWWP